MSEGGAGYRVELAKTGRASCKSNICGKSRIERGSLRFGTFVDTGRFQNWMWRHWGCVTDKVLSNVKTKIGDDIAKNLDGFDDVGAENQERILRAFENGHVEDADLEASEELAIDEHTRAILDGEFDSDEALSVIVSALPPPSARGHVAAAHPSSSSSKTRGSRKHRSPSVKREEHYSDDDGVVDDGEVDETEEEELSEEDSFSERPSTDDEEEASDFEPTAPRERSFRARRVVDYHEEDAPMTYSDDEDEYVNN
ncbi:zf-PARP type zinc finger protein [Schizosaccharomyces japonicus yFS275]|uniref:Zf-PARP type zinc finger protein n=1 Tax=Schizosaccharomyces japonicus (strain yFS275 / FY16936) TaxID=402676 RepID=B6JVZ0_SCHJY|nr:zf-PARP type zinc finger protein [Schizosaccharomyces japonicus yFS275]EEB05541.2 zf-PARP type zinc finger protein [Schizosaccharomyces japonicus yFS275]